ncbi:MAG: GNAT family N-acetyltransferase [Pseudomonadota bacterium]
MTESHIETDRLILRPIDAERDFEAWAACFADAETNRYLGGKPLDRALAWRNMAMVIGHWQLRGYGFFSVEEKASGCWVGRVGPWFPEGWPEPEIGWTIAREHCGKGFATEAGFASLQYVKDVLGWQQVIHAIVAGNTGSEAVATRLGSSLLREQQGLGGVTDTRVLIYGQSW